MVPSLERAFADDSWRRDVPLHRPHRVRHPRIEWIVLDGIGVRRFARHDGCRRAAEIAGGRNRDGAQVLFGFYRVSLLTLAIRRSKNNDIT
ncbi:MAG: hypothetical protein QM736_26380, partial [Vicinamibacterales bacterium]